MPIPRAYATGAAVFQPQSPEGTGITPEERQWGMFCHLSALLTSLVGMSFLGPLICWLARKDTSPWIDAHGREALNFQINVVGYIIMTVFLGVASCGIGFFLFIPLLVWVIVLPIVAGIQANDGRMYRYPLTVAIIPPRPAA